MAKKLLRIAEIVTVLLLLALIVRAIKFVRFDKNCTQYIKRAADSSKIETAMEELEKAISFVEENGITEGNTSVIIQNPKNDIEFWYKNMCDAYFELKKIHEGESSTLEEINVIIKLRDTLTDVGKKGIIVTIPQNISIYPYNAIYFWIILFLSILTPALWITTAIVSITSEN